jgi:hypothetical protein
MCDVYRQIKVLEADKSTGPVLESTSTQLGDHLPILVVVEKYLSRSLPRHSPLAALRFANSLTAFVAQKHRVAVQVAGPSGKNSPKFAGPT